MTIPKPKAKRRPSSSRKSDPEFFPAPTDTEVEAYKFILDQLKDVPVDGFYEWADLPPKEPHYIFPPEGLFSLAGVWKQAEKGLTFSVLTIAPNELIGSFHHRMPVILGHNAVSQWLAPDSDPQELTAFFQSFPASLMREHKVSLAVNNRKNDPSCIAPV
jgi:putative SOS response-associated peptidase YedK